jgi:hypothetical protein
MARVKKYPVLGSAKCSTFKRLLLPTTIGIPLKLSLSNCNCAANVVYL